ncbi:Ubiquitin carboxyl-terminal hydrolase [Echinococcus multilocularis]|uniref:Ubiquitin carboxyl-terminal hydrolase n=1 Tax=Echinococcus multilocularis TaxID=6211 RepID=A0A0S4MMV8_ECHMU|nr:Ubiquitin carboxyl-terminal hydrolase [Echinococcus multilocularis]
MKSYQAFHTFTSRCALRIVVQHHLTHLQEGSSEIVLIGQEEVAQDEEPRRSNSPRSFATALHRWEMLFVASADVSAYVCPSVASIGAKQQSQPKPPPPPHPRGATMRPRVTPCNTSTGSPSPPHVYANVQIADAPSHTSPSFALPKPSTIFPKPAHASKDQKTSYTTKWQDEDLPSLVPPQLILLALTKFAPVFTKTIYMNLPLIARKRLLPPSTRSLRTQCGGGSDPISTTRDYNPLRNPATDDVLHLKGLGLLTKVVSSIGVIQRWDLVILVAEHRDAVTVFGAGIACQVLNFTLDLAQLGIGITIQSTVRFEACLLRRSIIISILGGIVTTNDY